MVTTKQSVIIDFNPVLKNKILFLLIPQVKMVERPKLAAACGHYNHFYAQLDLLRERAHGPNYHHVPQRDSRDEENYDQKESHSPPPSQW